MDVNIQNVVVSSRIRLARNIRGYPFPHKLTNTQQVEEIFALVQTPLRLSDTFDFKEIRSLAADELQVLKENYLISQKLIQNKDISAVFISPDEKLSVMVNEEDHLRLQYCSTGYCLTKAYEYVNEIDDVIGKYVSYAYDGRWGFLTACPTNLGTGMRASVMLFLPGITKQHGLEQLSSGIKKNGLTIRGVYGEGSGSEGSLYQISNEITLGHSEQEILNVVDEEIKRIVTAETLARKEMYECDPVGVQDACGRAYGILCNCRRLPYGEFTKLMSDVKTGVCIGLFRMKATKQTTDLDDLFFAMRDYNIRRYFSGNMTLGEVEERRAENVSTKIKALLDVGE